MELQVEEGESMNYPNIADANASTIKDEVDEENAAQDIEMGQSPVRNGEDEETARLKELAADVQDQTDLERNIERQVCDFLLCIL